LRNEYSDLDSALQGQSNYWDGAKFHAMKVNGINGDEEEKMKCEAEIRASNPDKEPFGLLNYNCSTFVSDILNAGGVNVRSHNQNLLWAKVASWNYNYFMTRVIKSVLVTPKAF
jgi:hypothetical protein